MSFSTLLLFLQYRSRCALYLAYRGLHRSIVTSTLSHMVAEHMTAKVFQRKGPAKKETYSLENHYTVAKDINHSGHMLSAFLSLKTSIETDNSPSS